MQQAFKRIRQALERDKGDDLERAKRQFWSCTPDEMQEQYGQSGLTRAEILKGHEADREEWEAAMQTLGAFAELLGAAEAVETTYVEYRDAGCNPIPTFGTVAATFERLRAAVAKTKGGA
jgi:hypothetical protein